MSTYEDFLDFNLMRFEKFSQIRPKLFWKIFLSSKVKRFLETDGLSDKIFGKPW